MSIRVICGSCGKSVKAPDSAAGKRGKCPFCKNPVSIPSNIPTTKTDTQNLTDDKEPHDSQINNKPMWSTEVKCKSYGLKKHTWHLDIYYSHTIFADQNTSNTYRFPDEVKRHGFATALISGYNFFFVCNSKRYCFLLDKESLKHIKSLHIAQVYANEQKNLVNNIRVWVAVQLIACSMFFTSPKYSSNIYNLPTAFLFLLALIGIFLGFLAINAWWLKRWALLGEAIVYSVFSLLYLTMLTIHLPQLNPGILIGAAVSIGGTWRFYLAYKSGIRFEDYTTQSSNACVWSTLCHIAGLGGFIIPAAGCVIGPLIVWQIKKDLDPFVNYNGKEAMNFQISMVIYGAIAFILRFVHTKGLIIGSLLLTAVVIVDLFLVFTAAIRAGKGEMYRYPLTIRFIK